jgi:hypothetical protein
LVQELEPLDKRNDGAEYEIPDGIVGNEMLEAVDHRFSGTEPQIGDEARYQQEERSHVAIVDEQSNVNCQEHQEDQNQDWKSKYEHGVSF